MPPSCARHPLDAGTVLFCVLSLLVALSMDAQALLVPDAVPRMK